MRVSLDRKDLVLMVTALSPMDRKLRDDLEFRKLGRLNWGGWYWNIHHLEKSKEETLWHVYQRCKASQR